MKKSLRSYISAIFICTVIACIVISAVFSITSFAQQTAENKLLAKILVVGGSHFNPAKYQQITSVLVNHHIELTITNKDKLAAENVTKKLSQYDLVLFDVYSTRMAKKDFGQFKISLKALPALKALALNWFTDDGILQNINVQQAQAINDYISNGSKVNFDRISDYLAKVILTAKQSQDISWPKAAFVYPKQGIYHPDGENIYTSLSDYLAVKPIKSGKSMIGIAFNRSDIEREQKQVLDSLIRGIEAKGHNVLAFYYSGFESQGVVSSLITLDEKIVVDNIINFKSIHMASARRVEYEKLGKPVIQVLQYRSGDQSTWEKDNQGLSATMTPFYLTLPEGAGVIDPIVISAKGKDPKDMGVTTPQVIDYQLDSLVNRAINLAQLAKKGNKDKKVAVMVWNYPAGERNVGASFLNVPRSLAKISKLLAENDYQIKPKDDQFFIDNAAKILKPFYREYQLDELLKEDLAELMPLSTYLTWYNELPRYLRNDIEAKWGKPDNGFMQTQHQGETHFIIPRIRIGNLIVMRQPPRSDSISAEKKVYHSRIVPINHNYLAAYLYLKRSIGIDALVHLGTHGTQEYLTGKERALSVYDAGMLAVGDVPVIYPFIMDDVGEAMQTKRRGRAVVIAHLTPPFAASGLQQDFSAMHDLMHNYDSMDQGQVKNATRDKIISQCIALSLCEDIGWNTEKALANFSQFEVELHDYMSELASELQPLGLHTLAIQQDKLHTLSTIAQMLGEEFIEQAKKIELTSLTNNDSDNTEIATQDITKQPSIALIDQFGVKTLQKYLFDSNNPAPENIASFIEQAKLYHKGFKEQAEGQNFLKALSGQYVPVKNGGDPVRNPAALPSGSNLYGFDPAKLPTKEAYQTGTELLMQSINLYHKKHGKFPDKMAFSLWSIEAMRHHGVLESQLMAAMGIRPIWDKYGYVKGTEIIEYQELRRPRIDVVVSATSLYRDAFPNVMLLLAEAIDKIARLKEPYNHLYQNSQQLVNELKAQGIEENQADKLSTMRVFSNESGNYGSGLAGATMKSQSWQQDDKLASLYLDRMGYAFGKDVEDWGVKPVEGLKLYDKVLSGTDIAVLSRSSNVYGMLSSDDPFQYLGGISLAVRKIDGKSPELMIANLRNPKGIKVEQASRFLGRELKTRSLHLRWVKEMQDEGYSGAIAMLSRINNFWGWQVMDPNIVTENQWQQLFEVYVQDKLDVDINEWFDKVHPEAQAQLIERMLETIRKEYWQASDEVTEELLTRYLALANSTDIVSYNDKFNEFSANKALGFGLTALLPATMLKAKAVTQSQSASQQVSGMKLEEQNQQSETMETDWSRYYPIIILIVIFILGFLSNFIRLNLKNKNKQIEASS
ncbi:MAG: cobaltochelatase subunit CobN [Colwellia sp.]|nr:cobaltochelatase subunit CobN [Colwellia sp.]